MSSGNVWDDTVSSASDDEQHDEQQLGGPWTTIDQNEFRQENSYVSESMYLVLEDRLAQLLPDEKIQAKAHALTTKNISDDLNAGTSGTLFLTSYRVLFQPFQNARSTNRTSPSRAQDFTVELPLCSIASVKIESCYGSSYLVQVLEIGTKDFRVQRFGFPYDFSQTPLSSRIMSINQGLSAALVCVERPMAAPNEAAADTSWDVYDPTREYQRLKLVPGPLCKQRSKAKWPWRIAHVNKDYSFCATYPKAFVVPSSVSDEDLWRSRRFRMKERVPAIVYLHHNGACISRCSQPMVGLRRARGILDEKLVAAMKRAGNQQPAVRGGPAKTQKPLYFVDCRNQTAALGNMAMGGGFESTHHYADSHIQFMGIENIHAMRESFRRIYELCRSTALAGESERSCQSQWLSQLENTRWLEHIRVVLVAAKQCAAAVEKGSSLVIHCSDGWDRTAQVVGLAEILLDPFYRTTRGFQILVEKEWCSFGHRFADRCGHSGRGVNFWEDESCSPVFVQFLDCVWQLMEQFPFAFEFNANFLIALQSELYSARSGTFLQNNEAERTRLNVQDRCFSVWALLKNSVDADKFANPFYMPTSMPTSTGGGGGGGGGDASESERSKVLVPDCHPSCIKFWAQCYFKHLMMRKAGLMGNQETCAKDLLRAVQDMAKEKEELETKLRNARMLLAAEHTTSTRVRDEIETLREENASLLRHVAAEEVLAEDLQGEDGDGVLLTHTHSVKQGSSNSNSNSNSGTRRIKFAVDEDDMDSDNSSLEEEFLHETDAMGIGASCVLLTHKSNKSNKSGSKSSSKSCVVASKQPPLPPGQPLSKLSLSSSVGSGSLGPGLPSPVTHATTRAQQRSTAGADTAGTGAGVASSVGAGVSSAQPVIMQQVLGNIWGSTVFDS